MEEEMERRRGKSDIKSVGTGKIKGGRGERSLQTDRWTPGILIFLGAGIPALCFAIEQAITYPFFFCCYIPPPPTTYDIYL